MIQKTRLQILHWLAYSNDEKQTKEKKENTKAFQFLKNIF